MEELKCMPRIVIDSPDEQAKQIKELLDSNKGRGVWYSPPNNKILDPSIEPILESKGLKVFDQTKYSIVMEDGKKVWTSAGKLVVENPKHVYWIGIPGRFSI